MKYVLGLLLASSLLINTVEVEASVPKCSSCTVYATGKDGTLWGWEDEHFCKLPKRCGVVKKNKKTKIVTKKITTKKSKSSSKKTTKKSSTSKKTTKKTTKKSTSSTSKPTTSATSAAHKTNDKGELICNECVVTSTGGDGSLWGWESEKSCKIDNEKCKGKIQKQDNKGKAESNHKKDAQGNLICNGCNVTATGGDFSLWGWEDEASCIIDNTLCNIKGPEPPKTTTPLQRGQDGILICSTCEYTRKDPDTTTWNTENGEPCRVIGSRCGFNTTPHPWCSGCVVTGTGMDGALYGWENTASCLINEKTCGLVDSNNQPTGANAEDSSALSMGKMSGFYYMMASLVTLLIVRGY